MHEPAFFRGAIGRRIFAGMSKPTVTSGITTATNAQAMWLERVQAWRDSGKTAKEFAESGGFSTGTLRWWASRVAPIKKARFVQLVPKSKVVNAPSERVVSAPSELIVEIAGAQIRVRPGFNPQLFAEVVRALSHGSK